MLWDSSELKGYAVEAADGHVGSVSDVLFEDDTWAVRWLVVDTGHWITGRKVLLPPSVVGLPDAAARQLPIKLTTQQVKDAPDVDTEQPVSRRLQADMDNYYNSWGLYPGGPAVPLSNAMAVPLALPFPISELGQSAPPTDRREPDAEGDPHLRSVVAITGYHIHATDGEIGHAENFLIDDADWRIRFITVDTRNWWPGEKVLISQSSVQRIEWTESLIYVDIDRERIKAAPRYHPASAGGPSLGPFLAPL